MKYIFVAGAPGSKWSSVVKNIYYSEDVDRSDYRDTWTYYHDASGNKELMHLGAYFDPGMESNLPENFHELSRNELEQIFDSPFGEHNGKVRIIKSHIFANHIDFLRDTFPDTPIVLVHRGDDACLGWWVKCGHFDITYPVYEPYYRNLRTMAGIIKQQNAGILSAWWKYSGRYCENNQQLAKALKIAVPPLQYQQDYAVSDVRVKVI
jgi:protoporphyrinogen oxidase